jgi:hypothetical protein
MRLVTQQLFTNGDDTHLTDHDLFGTYFKYEFGLFIVLSAIN